MYMLEKILNNLRTYPDRIAYRSDTAHTYGELHAIIRAVYEYLSDIGSKSPIVVFGHKSIYIPAAFLGCAFAGIPYVPVDSSTPRARFDAICNEVRPQLVFDDNKIKEIMNKYSGNIELIPKMRPDDIFYIIMTSGSSGIPKGVRVTYNNLCAFVDWFGSIAGRECSSLGHAAFSFDLSVADLYPTFTSAGTLTTLTRETQNDYARMFATITESRCERIIMTPTFADLLLADCDFCSKDMQELQQIFFCGEILRQKTVLRLFERFPSLEIINAYGPTECTVAVTAVTITPDMARRGDIPIGMAGGNVFLNNLCGENGEFIITGGQVASYIGEDAGGFYISDNMAAYRTGDIGFVRNGMMYYSHRVDRQIKYRGYRVELDDIERNITSVDGVRNAAVVTQKRGDVARRLVAYVVADIDAKQLTAEIARKLPSYMCPQIIFIDALPVSVNGKLDYKLLEEMCRER